MLNSKIERIKTNGHEKEKEKYGEACVYIFSVKCSVSKFVVPVSRSNLQRSRWKRKFDNLSLLALSHCSSSPSFPIFRPSIIFFFCYICIFSNSHTLNIHRSTPHPTSCLLFTPLNSYSVCFIILHTRTSRSLVSYSWNNVLTGGYTVCIFTALMYVQFAFICKYNGYSIKTRDDNNH